MFYHGVAIAQCAGKEERKMDNRQVGKCRREECTKSVGGLSAGWPHQSRHIYGI